MNHHLDKIDNDIAEKNLLKHPFYLAWTRGELSGEALADYARQYYHHVAAFPTYLSAVHANCDDQATRKQLLHNLIDEEAGSPNHPELWLKFARGLGVEDVDVRTTEKQPETEGLIDTFQSVCRDGSTAEGLAALYAYESQIPAICESKIDGLKKHYGFSGKCLPGFAGVTPSRAEIFLTALYEHRNYSAVMDRCHSSSRRDPFGQIDMKRLFRLQAAKG